MDICQQLIRALLTSLILLWTPMSYAAEITISIPDAQIPRIVAAFTAQQYGNVPPCRQYTVNVPATPLDDTVHCVVAFDTAGIPSITVSRANYPRFVLAHYIRATVSAYEANLAGNAAAQTARDTAESELGTLPAQ